MGFLLFAYRKLSLKRQINDLTYQSMCFQQQKEDITRQIGEAQQNISNQKNMLSVFSSMGMAGLSQKIFGSDPNVQITDQVQYQKMMMDYNRQAQIASMTNNAMNSVFENQSRVQLAQLSAVDKEIDMKIANNDSQLAQMKAEEQSVEKAEGEEAKQAAPKFGLG